MKAGVKGIIAASLEAAFKDGSIDAPERLPDIIVERPKKEGFGDFSTNISMLLAPLVKKKPVEIAWAAAKKIALSREVSKCEVAGPGFINIFLSKDYWLGCLADILKKGADYGKSDIGGNARVQVEFVSANPTGPLHIGHGRGAAAGDALARILKFAGFDVTKEFYINDKGRQILTLGESVRLRYKEMQGEKIQFPDDFYKGDYVKDISASYAQSISGITGSAPTFQEFACEKMLLCIKEDLKDFGVEFDVWFSERRDLDDKGRVTDALAGLAKKGLTYEKDGALWFRTTGYGDDKDRVLRKADGELTYFASDVAYHLDKIRRGFTTLVNVWGADHHGYEARVRAVFKSLGYDDKMLKIVFIQLVALLRAGVPVPMGKREGEFVTLRQVMDEVGRDACRFFFLMRKADAHLDFDLELAKRQAPENPVYYVQYCRARISSIFEFAGESGYWPQGYSQGNWPKGYWPAPPAGAKILERLTEKDELDIIKHLGSFTETVERSALNMEPHRLTFYLMELAGLFHPYYNRNRVVTDDRELTEARLHLCKAVGTVAENGLGLLGISAPVKM
ncbi:MAG: arginine--tRNA ligase [Deltaproteobacteria bacterium]|nr:arginine--tRNA ligase [Deltaproteobacteria bacterium]